jgi:hypothetical protein
MAASCVWLLTAWGQRASAHRRLSGLTQHSGVTVLTSERLSEERLVHFHFALGPGYYVAIGQGHVRTMPYSGSTKASTDETLGRQGCHIFLPGPQPHLVPGCIN